MNLLVVLLGGCCLEGVCSFVITPGHFERIVGVSQNKHKWLQYVDKIFEKSLTKSICRRSVDRVMEKQVKVVAPFLRILSECDLHSGPGLRECAQMQHKHSSHRTTEQAPPILLQMHQQCTNLSDLTNKFLRRGWNRKRFTGYGSNFFITRPAGMMCGPDNSFFNKAKNIFTSKWFFATTDFHMNFTFVKFMLRTFESLTWTQIVIGKNWNVQKSLSLFGFRPEFSLILDGFLFSIFLDFVKNNMVQVVYLHQVLFTFLMFCRN